MCVELVFLDDDFDFGLPASTGIVYLA